MEIFLTSRGNSIRCLCTRLFSLHNISVFIAQILVTILQVKCKDTSVPKICFILRSLFISFRDVTLYVILVLNRLELSTSEL